jgi:predicted DNA-binding transcriptional regulator AlpA
MSEQELFNERYICAPEIMELLGVTRTALLRARRTGKLPDSISVPSGPFMWNRERVAPSLKAWKEELDARRGVANAC